MKKAKTAKQPISQPTIEIGNFTRSTPYQKLRQPGVLDQGVVYPFTVTLPDRNFSGIAFPALKQHQHVGVTLVTLPGGTTPAHKIQACLRHHEQTIQQAIAKQFQQDVLSGLLPLHQLNLTADIVQAWQSEVAQWEPEGEPEEESDWEMEEELFEIRLPTGEQYTLTFTAGTVPCTPQPFFPRFDPDWIQQACLEYWDSHDFSWVDRRIPQVAPALKAQVPLCGEELPGDMASALSLPVFAQRCQQEPLPDEAEVRAFCVVVCGLGKAMEMATRQLPPLSAAELYQVALQLTGCQGEATEEGRSQAHN